ncbi:MAG: hypothetical protein ABSG76_14195, partial [Xanthobacteraceae bacterium]
TAAYVTLRNSASRAAYDERLEAARRRRRRQMTHQVLGCAVVAAVTFVVASGVILLLRQHDAVTASVDAPPVAEPAPRSTPSPLDELTDVAAVPPGPRHDIAPPLVVTPGSEPPREEAAPSPQPLERAAGFAAAAANGEPPGEAARRSAVPTDTAEVRVTTSGTFGDVARTVTVPREQSASSDDSGGTPARGHMAAIRVWTALPRHRADGASSYRMQQFTVGRERRRPARWAGAVISTGGSDAWIPFASR